MKITKLTTYRLPPRWLFLKIETDEGVVGWGEPVIEGRARTVEAAVHELGEYLIGADPARISAVGLGESQPIADNNTPAGREQNRRVVGVIKASITKDAK